MFRWKRTAPHQWVGVDGDHWYEVEGAAGDYTIRSNASEEDFEKLFRLGSEWGVAMDAVHRIGPELAPFTGRLNGLRLMRPSGRAETLFCFLCTPNNQLKRIIQMVEVLASYGEPRTDGWTRFPSVERVASLDESELRARGFGYRGATIPYAAREILSRGAESYLNHLAEAPYDEAVRELTSIKGIGPKLADCIALFALHHTEAVPIDTHMYQAFVRLYHPELAGKALTDARYRLMAEAFRARFGRWSAYAHQFLFTDNLLHWREYRKGTMDA